MLDLPHLVSSLVPTYFMLGISATGFSVLSLVHECFAHMSHQIVNLSWVGLDLEYPLVFGVFPRCWAAIPSRKTKHHQSKSVHQNITKLKPPFFCLTLYFNLGRELSVNSIRVFGCQDLAQTLAWVTGSLKKYLLILDKITCFFLQVTYRYE